ncbi:MAG TPA: exonuclease domain-containing protein [Burkholderiales bacterium]|nr:exonuclease domain-containing protein [Burkholderiales bacterium]
MKLRLAAAWAVCFGLLLGAGAALLFMLDASFGLQDRETFRRLLSGSQATLLLLVAIACGASGFLANWLIRTYVASARRLTESTRLIAGGNPSYRIEAEGPAEWRELSGAINVLAAQHEGVLRDVEARISQARLDFDQERIRLAALMSELSQSVVVCNLEGRILLYNERARQVFSGLEDEAGGPASSYIGLGRSLYTLLDQDLMSHALEQLRQRFAQGETWPVVVFMAAIRTGQLVRAQLAPVAGHGTAPGGELAGFVLLLEDIGEAVTRAERRDRLLQRYTEDARAALASVRAAVENLVNYPEMDVARRRQFTGIISEEADRLTGELQRTAREYSEHVMGEWLPEQIRAIDLIDVMRRRISGRVGLPTSTGEIDASLWVNADSFIMVQAVCFLAHRLKYECQVREVAFAVGAAGRHAQFSLTWTGARLSSSTVQSWDGSALVTGGESSALTFREVLNRHHGEAWYEFDPASSRSSFRLLLPLAEPEKTAASVPARPSRPEYYDFDLFHQPGQTRELDDRLLKDLTYTVFDTETTGLEPSAGDEIIAIGAVRIVNGRLLSGEVFDQLVDPRRSLQPASMKIHGIRPEMLQGRPTIERVLPAFHKFCEDTVLVGHNAAFDMRFLRLKEEALGVRFAHPVLDTLLLSALLHENLASHQLETIAGRFGVNTAGRHTAVGDAVMTGEVFLRMIPLLSERGIETLGRARDACERTYYARLRY